MFVPLPPLSSLSGADEWGVIFALVFMAIDMASGVICAFARHEFESTRMREGLLHKALVSVVIVLAVALQQASSVLDMGFEVPSVPVTCAMVIVMEVGSVIETVGKTYPRIADSPLLRAFGHGGRDGDGLPDSRHPGE